MVSKKLITIFGTFYLMQVRKVWRKSYSDINPKDLLDLLNS